jgi:hypothetical protein
LINKFCFNPEHGYLSHEFADFQSIILCKTLRGKLLDQFDPTRAQGSNKAPLFNFLWLAWYRELQSAVSKAERKLDSLSFIGEEETLEWMGEEAMRVQPTYESRFSESNLKKAEELAPRKPKKNAHSK